MTDIKDLPDNPFKIERLMREAKRHFPELHFASETEFRDALPDLYERGINDLRKESLANNPAEMAQELAYQAYESGHSDRATKIVNKALKLDPNCVDALTVKAFVDSDSAGDLIPALENALACGEEKLGEAFFKSFKGDFWEMIELRPYLRTMKQQSRILWSAGRRFDTIDLMEDVRELDPDDYIGICSLLLASYLSMGEVQRSWDLIEEQDQGQDLVYVWAWVLLYLMTESFEEAIDALDQALDANEFVVPFLFRLEDPMCNPPYLTPGSKDEAAICVQIIGEAWESNPDAMIWLHNALVDIGLLEIDEDNPLARYFTSDKEEGTKH